MAGEYNTNSYSNGRDSIPEPMNGPKANYVANGCADCAGRGLCRKHDVRATKNFATPGGISISPELFEKMFLAPQDTGRGGLAETFGNPTPVGLLGIMLSLTPLSCDLMGWRGAGGEGYASVGVYLFFGGVLLLIGGVLEWIVGQTLNHIVFMTYGAFWLTLYATLEPSFMAFAAYAPPGTPAANAGLVGIQSTGFNASFGFFMLFMGLLNFVFLICSIKTDVVHVIIFATLVIAFGLLTGEYFNLAMANQELAAQLSVAAGVSLFITSMSVWYSFFSLMLEIMEFPFRIPVGDLSNLFRDPRAKAMGHMV